MFSKEYIYLLLFPDDTEHDVEVRSDRRRWCSSFSDIMPQYCWYLPDVKPCPDCNSAGRSYDSDISGVQWTAYSWYTIFQRVLLKYGIWNKYGILHLVEISTNYSISTHPHPQIMRED